MSTVTASNQPFKTGGSSAIDTSDLFDADDLMTYEDQGMPNPPRNLDEPIAVPKPKQAKAQAVAIDMDQCAKEDSDNYGYGSSFVESSSPGTFK